MAMNNYPNAGRRVRPTTPKLSKAQIVALELCVKHNGSITRKNRGSDYRTLKALRLRGLLYETDKYSYVDGWYTEFEITDTGRAALQAAQS